MLQLFTKKNILDYTLKPEPRPLQNILVNAGVGTCFAKCLNQGIGKTHTHTSWNFDAYTIVPRQIPPTPAFPLWDGNGAYPTNNSKIWCLRLK
jgi:hypothetical protein